MAVSHRFQDSCYVNWVKAGQGLVCTAEGLYAFCEDHIKKYHRGLHQQFPPQPCTGPCREQGLCPSCLTRHQEWEQDILSQLTPDSVPGQTHPDKPLWERDEWEIAQVLMGPDNDSFRAGGGDTIALLQLVVNCRLFDPSIANKQSFLKVIEIRKNLFQSADLRVSDAALKDHITAMVTVLEDPTLLKNDTHAMQAVQQLHQIEERPLDTNNQDVVELERILWQQKMICIIQDQSLSQPQLNTFISFVTAQDDLNRAFQVEIDSLKARLESTHTRTDDLQEKQRELFDWIAPLEVTNAVERDQSTADHAQQKDPSRLTNLEMSAEEYQQHIKERLQHLKQQLRSVQQRKIETFLREKRYAENIRVDNLSDIYIDPFIHDVERSEPIKVEELLSPDPQSGQIPQRVLLYGPGGIGKTMAVLSLLNMWVHGMLPSIENLFFFSMRELSLLRPPRYSPQRGLRYLPRRWSLADLLFTHQGIQKPNADIVDKYFANMSQSLFIFEDCEPGLYTSELESKPIYYNTEVKVANLVGSIICGKVMSGARVLVTARPGAVSEDHIFDRKAEMYGFDESRIDRYVSMFCEGSNIDKDSLESLIRNYIDDNKNNIASFCYVPVFGNILCRIAKLTLQRHNRMSLPKTITQLLTTSVLAFAIEHHPDIKGTKPSENDDVIAQLKDLLLHHSNLAKEGMKHLPVKLLFSEDDLKRSGLSKSTARQLGLLMVFMDKVQGPVSSEDSELHCFVNVITQEFLAAIGLVSNIGNIERQMANTPNVGQLDMVLTFLSGLTSDPANRHFLESLGFQKTVTAADLLRLIMNQDYQNRRRNLKRTILLLLRLVNESRQPDLWVVIKDFILNYAKDFFGNDVRELNLKDTEISPAEIQALIYVMPNMDGFTVLNMDSCSIHGTSLVAALGLLTQLTCLSLNNNQELHGLDVTTILTSSLMELVLLEDLSIQRCLLDDEDIFQLSSALVTLKRLKLIELSSNSVTDTGAQRLAETVSNLQRLVYLGLANNWLTESGVWFMRRTVNWDTRWGQERVHLALLDLQRPLGQEVDHPDRVVRFQRVVANLTLGVTRLHSRPVLHRDRFWGENVVKMEGELAITQDLLRLAEDVRDEGAGPSSLVRLQHILHREKTLIQNRHGY